MAVEARPVGPGGARSVSGQVRQSRQVMSTFCGVSPGSASYGSQGCVWRGMIRSRLFWLVDACPVEAVEATYVDVCYRLLSQGMLRQLRNGTVWWRGVRVSLGTANYKLYIPRR